MQEHARYNTNVTILRGENTIKHFPSATGGTVKVGIGTFKGAVVSAGSAVAILTIYDGTDSTGTVLFTVGAIANNQSALLLPVELWQPVSNLFVSLSGTGSKATILYE